MVPSYTRLSATASAGYPTSARLVRGSGAAIGVGIVSGDSLGFGIDRLYAQRGIIGGKGNSRELDYIDVPIYLAIVAPADRQHVRITLH